MVFKKIRKSHVDWRDFLCGTPASDYIFQKDAYEAVSYTHLDVYKRQERREQEITDHRERLSSAVSSLGNWIFEVHSGADPAKEKRQSDTDDTR